MYTVISCFCWWRCTVWAPLLCLVGFREIVVAVLLSCWMNRWQCAVWVCWLLHSQHVSEDILQWSIHGRYETDDIHTYQQQIGLLFGLKMQGFFRRCWRTYIVKRFQGSWFGSKAPEQQDSSRLHNYWSTHWFLHVGTCSKHPNFRKPTYCRCCCHIVCRMFASEKGTVSVLHDPTKKVVHAYFISHSNLMC